MIHEIHPHVFDNSYGHKRPMAADVALCFSHGRVLLKTDSNANRLPTVSDLEVFWPNAYEDALYLFSIDHTKYFLVPKAEAATPTGYEFWSIQQFRKMRPKHEAFAGVTASHLYSWLRDNRFCGRCGALMKQAASERALVCHKCENRVYPRICPAVIVAVTHGDRLLMARSARGFYRRFGLIAGFVEVGESLERTVEREVMEEVGLKIKDIRYYKSQPWGFSDSLMVGFFARLDGEPSLVIERSELAEARWFKREEITEEPSFVSIGSEMIRAFKSGVCT